MRFAVLTLWLFCLLTLFACGGSPRQSALVPSAPASGAPPSSNPPPDPAPTPAPAPDPAPASLGATMQCPAGQYDMLDWATLDPDLSADHHLEGNANPLYTYVEDGKFYWMKGAKGFPWDIQLTDNNNIYLWVTEQDWDDPDTFKKSHNNTNMPLTTRCAQGGEPGATVKSENTSFEIVHKCNSKKVSNLGKMVNQVWGPRKMNFGGDIPDNIDTLIVSYRYNCDRDYERCADQEQFYMTERYGLVKWDHSKWKDGKYDADNKTVYNRLVHGGPSAPEFPCQ